MGNRSRIGKNYIILSGTIDFKYSQFRLLPDNTIF